MPLIQGNRHRVSTFDQQYLATWITKTIMVGEFLYPDRVAIPDLERLWLYAKLEPPENWSIWIAPYSGIKWRNLTMSHHICALKPPKTLGPSEIAPPDTQFTSIGMGHLFIQVVSTTTGLEFGPDDDSVTDLRRIWPPTRRDMLWAPVSPLSDIAADYIAGSLARIAGIPASP
jgi:hypothetical protein